MVNKKKKSLFKELILEKEFFTLMNKWKLFRELISHLGIKNITEDERKELLTLTKESTFPILFNKLITCVSNSCKDNVGESTSTYFNLKLPDIQRGNYQGNIIISLY